MEEEESENVGTGRVEGCMERRVVCEEYCGSWI